MNKATLGQGNQVLNLILDQSIPTEQLQVVIESGLLSDLLAGNITDVNRNDFREMLGYELWGWGGFFDSAYPVERECPMKKPGCEGSAPIVACGKNAHNGHSVGTHCCNNGACKEAAEARTREGMGINQPHDRWMMDEDH